MLRKLSVPILLALLFTGSLTAQAWWEKRPYLEWSVREVDRMLNDSPWVAITPFRLLRPSVFPLNLRILLISARPVREAYLRRLSFPADVQKRPDFENTIPLDQAKAKSKAGESQARLERFIKANQGDIRVRGDDRHIVIAMVLTQFVPPSSPGPITAVVSRPSWLEEPRPKFLMGLKLSDWVSNTFLSTNRGRRVEIVRYEPPGLDLLGAKFYFPRALPDGTPLIDNGDNELQFETRIDGKQVKVKFDLRKTLYKGKVET